MEERPNPEDLLELVKREESEKEKGKLKIFLGMAAGVGKTYAMLEAAQRLKGDGVDIVVGVAETHGREETARLLEGLEKIPLLKIDYKGSAFYEIDIDAIIKRNPQIVIIDELAHSNVSGSRHPKRWQDVLEVLDNDIDVYTTLNVQHIESRSDLVEGISGITIRETVPDSIIDRANSIELIDITPEELLERLQEGKVYLGNQSVIAARNFFQKDRLTALREIVMRYAAEKVDHDLHGMFSMVERVEAWKTRERLLVAVSHHPHAQKLIRITRRLAFTLNAPWIALHVDDGKMLDEEDQRILENNLTLARDLGAEVITAHGEDIAQVVQRVARQKSVTQIIVGRSPVRWPWLTKFFSSDTLLDRLSRECSDIDLHVIRKTAFSRSSRRNWANVWSTQSAMSYVIIFLIIVLMSILNGIVSSYMGYQIAGYLFLMSILVLSLFFKKGPIIFASIAYSLVWYFYFIPGNSEFIHAPTRADLVLLSTYLGTAVFMGILIDRAKTSNEMLLKREKSLESLYEVVKDIANASSFDEMASKINSRIGMVLNGISEIVPKKIDDGLIFTKSTQLLGDEKEKGTAQWVFQNGNEAGWSTSTLPMSKNLYIPLKSSNEIVGVIAFHPNRDRNFSIEEKSFLYTVGQQVANYLERGFSIEKERRLDQHREVEKIYQSLLHLISNLFEGPILAIKDGLKELNAQNDIVTSSVVSSNLTAAVTNLERILINISAMVNLSAGLSPLNKSLHNICQLIQTCHAKLLKTAPKYKWDIRINETLPDIRFDYDLIELVINNLVQHALEFSLPESTIRIMTGLEGKYETISIQSEGQTIPVEVFDVAFEKLYRMPGTKFSGLGFGMAIAKAIAEVHQGKLLVNQNPTGGMIFILYLPIETT